jgi:tetratricopeptide (TPR) repeat protein
MQLKTTKAAGGLLIVLALSFPCVHAQETKSDGPAPQTDWSASKLDIWNDPTFQKEFIAGYGINSEIEPHVTPEEVALLEKVRPLMADNLPKAEAMLLKGLKPDSSPILYFTLGGIYFQQDKMPEALFQYLKAVEKFPNFRRAWRNLGLIHARQGKFDDAIRAFTKMIELGGADALSYGLLGYAYASKQDYQAAEAAYRNALLLQPENTEWRLGVTRCVFKQQKFEEAITLLETLIERYPDKADFWLLQAQAFLGVKQPLKAAQNLELVDRLGKAKADSLFTLGDIYLSENLIELSARAYVRAMDADAAQPPAHAVRCAEMLAARGATAQAKEIVEHIKKTRKDAMAEGDRRGLLKLEARLAMSQGGDDVEAAKILEEVVKLDPLDGEALMLLGQHYARKGEPERAIFYYERAESIDAFEANAKIYHAQALVKTGHYTEAIPLLRRAQEVKPREDVARYLEQVERLSKTR